MKPDAPKFGLIFSMRSQCRSGVAVYFVTVFAYKELSFYYGSATSFSVKNARILFEYNNRGLRNDVTIYLFNELSSLNSRPTTILKQPNSQSVGSATAATQTEINREKTTGFVRRHKIRQFFHTFKYLGRSILKSKILLNFKPPFAALFGPRG
jgi:hypothetical protein